MYTSIGQHEKGPLLPAAFRARDEFLAVLWADDGARLRGALNGLLERAYAKRQALFRCCDRVYLCIFNKMII